MIANNIVDKAAGGISVTNLTESGKLAVVQGNLIRNIFFRKDTDSRGIGIAVQVDSVVSGKRPGARGFRSRDGRCCGLCQPRHLLQRRVLAQITVPHG